MIKKPKKPLQGTNLLLQGAPNSKYQKDYKSYLTNMFICLTEEAKSTNPVDVIVFMAEKYHPTFKNKEKRGPKSKWSSSLKAMLAITIEEMIASGDNRKSALHKLSRHPEWKKMIRDDSLDGCEALNKAAKEGKANKNIYKCFKSIHKSSNNWNELISLTIQKSIFQD